VVPVFKEFGLDKFLNSRGYREILMFSLDL
jgi:hypothetical protein